MTTRPPIVDCEMLHPSLFADDIAAAVDFCVRTLGFTEAFRYGDPVRMAGLCLGDGLRDYSVRDLNGYYLTFGRRLSGSMAEGEPVEIERVDVPVRLEELSPRAGAT